MFRSAIALFTSLALAGVALPAWAAEGDSLIEAAVADPVRPAADRARDQARKPAEIVRFAGIEPGDVVAEIAPGGGYFTRILAVSVGPEGHIYAMMPQFMAERPGGLDAINEIADFYGNVTVMVVDFADFELEEPVDLVWTTENYHDLANGDIAAVNQSVFKALKPGGTYFVEDHSAPGMGLSVTSTLHRIDPVAVVDGVIEAGFVLEAELDILSNPDDPHDVSVRDPSVAGQTDKFALRFRKPE